MSPIQEPPTPQDNRGFQAFTFPLASGISPDAAQGTDIRPVDDIADFEPLPAKGAITRNGTELHEATAWVYTSPAGRIAILQMPCPNLSDGTQLFAAVDTSNQAILELFSFKPAAFGDGAGIAPAFKFSGEEAQVVPGIPVTVTIYRTAFVDSPATVLVQSVDGTAVAGVDYLAVHQALNFAAGEVSKTVTVTTIDHGQSGLGQLQLVLSQPGVGSFIDFPGAYNITILGSY